MEKTFNKIVLSQAEPQVSDLWMRINIEKTPDGKAIHGHSLWWFTSQGWKKLFDFDTRYNTTTDFKYATSDKPFESESVYDSKTGVVSISNAYHLYDGSRELTNGANIVLESGLKKHVDNLQLQINKVNDRVTTLTNTVNQEIQDRISGDNNLSGRINNLQDAVDKSLDTLITIGGNINSINERLTNLESQL